jgi:hypothetical protein
MPLWLAYRHHTLFLGNLPQLGSSQRGWQFEGGTHSKVVPKSEYQTYFLSSSNVEINGLILKGLLLK